MGGGVIQEMGAVKKPVVDVWARSAAKDRFSGPNSMNQKAYEVERAKTPVRANSPGSAKPAVTKAKPRASSAPKPRPAPEASDDASSTATPQKLGPSSVKLPIAQCPRTPNAFAAPAKSPKGTSPEQPLGSAGRSASSAFASSKGRFDTGVGSMYSKSVAPGPGAFNPDDLGSGIGSKSVGGVKSKPSPGMAPTSKGRFDSGPGSIYTAAAPSKKTPMKKKSVAPEDTAAEEWSKKLGLGALAGAKAAPVLKAVDEARMKAEAIAAEAVVAKEAAEEAAREAIRKADWMTETASKRVAEAAERAEAAEAELDALRAQVRAQTERLNEAQERIAAAETEITELRNQLPKRNKSPGSNRDVNKVIDRRPVRLRGQVDAEKEENHIKVEERKKKREEHWKKVEAERLAKEEAIRQEQLAKAQISQRSSARRGSSPPPPKLDALKGFALVLPAAPATISKRGPPSERLSERTAEAPSSLRRSSARNSAAMRRTATALASEDGSAELPLTAPSTLSADMVEARATGMVSSSPSPVASPAGVGNPANPGEEGDFDARAPVFFQADDEFAYAEAEAERQAAHEEARKASETADAEQQASADPKMRSLRSGDNSLDMKTKTPLTGYDDLGDDIEEGESAHDAAKAALKLVTGSSTLDDSLFAKAPRLNGSGSLSSSFSGIRLSEAMGSLPHDEFLDRLQRAEAHPASPGGMKNASLLPSSSLFNRGVMA